MGKRLTSPYLLLTLAMLFWSGNFIVGRAVHETIPPIGLAFWRWLVGTLIVSAFAWPYLRRDWPTIWRHRRRLALLALLGVATFNTLVYTGLRSTSAINGLLMQSMMPVLIVVLSYLLFREAITSRQVFGLFLSLGGALTVIARGDLVLLLSLSLNSGDLLVLIAVISYAAYSVLLRRRPELHPLSFLAATFAAGASMLLPFYLWESIVGQPMPLDQISVVTVSYVAIFPSILAYLFYNRGVELLGANRASLFLHLMPAFGSGMAIVFLDETVGVYHAIGIVMIVSGILLATKFNPRPA